MKQCYFCKRDEATYVGESYNKENSFQKMLKIKTTF